MKTLLGITIYLIVLLLPVVFASFIEWNWDWYSYLTSPEYVDGRFGFVFWFVILTGVSIAGYIDISTTTTTSNYEHYL